jgi:HK97 gp10 family phage protein
MGVELIVKVDRLPEIIAKLPDAVSQVLAKVALDIESDAKTRAPVKTGHLRGSVQAGQESQLAWRIGVGAEYGIYVEMGTRFMGARPFLTPAVEHARGGFESAFRALEGLL